MPTDLAIWAALAVAPRRTNLILSMNNEIDIGVTGTLMNYQEYVHVQPGLSDIVR